LRNDLTYNERIEQNKEREGKKKEKKEYHMWNQVLICNTKDKHTQLNNINVENEKERTQVNIN
jgi:hypothetical protein